MSLPQKTCAVTLDLENDVGGRRGLCFDSITLLRLEKLVSYFNSQNIPLSIFLVGKLLEAKPQEIRFLQTHLRSFEFHLHSFSHNLHTDDFQEEVRKGVAAFSSFFGYPPRGYRAPQGRITPSCLNELKNHGFRFDSSITPTVRPGVFNFLLAQDSPFFWESFNLWEIPCSVFPGLKVPIGLGYMRVMGLHPVKFLFRQTHLPEIIVLNFHLHDIFLSAHSEHLPPFWKWFYRKNVENGFQILNFCIEFLKGTGYRFLGMQQLLDRFSA